MSNQVVIRTCSYRHEAEFLKSVLDGHGIASTVGADDEGTLHPALGLVRGVHLFVAVEDAEQASDILDAHEDEAESLAEGEDDPAPAE
jgi:hypothetical protein